jgi:predicted transcriptional regulator
MLKDVLRSMDESGALLKSKISKDLNINESVLEDLIQQLIRMNYLQEDLGSPTCKTKCSSCPLSSCNTTPIKMYKITPKGKSLLNS